MASARVERRRERVRDEILDAAWEVAREDGLVGMSLRRVAEHVGMQAPSLYSYFDNKDAIYDAMFASGYETFAARMPILDTDGRDLRDVLVDAATSFVAFSNEDTVRFQLLFQHAVPGWRPSADAYAVAEEVFAAMRDGFAEAGITSPASLDVWTALTQGLASQQVANDAGGDRWLRLVEGAVDMYLAHHAPGRPPT